MSQLREKLVEMRAQAQHMVEESIRDWGHTPLRTKDRVKCLDEVIQMLDEVELGVQDVTTAIRQSTSGPFCYVGPLDEGVMIVDGSVDIIALTAKLNQKRSTK